MIWLCHVKNAAVLKKAVETTVTKQNYNTAPRLKTRLVIQMQKQFESIFFITQLWNFRLSQNVILPIMLRSLNSSCDYRILNWAS